MASASASPRPGTRSGMICCFVVCGV